jgi:membrane-bound inhibitor of C-type lysozyme
MKRLGIVLAATVALGGCQTMGSPGGSTFFECDRGTRLTVTYIGPGASVRVNDGRPIILRQVGSNAGTAYEGGGYMMQVNGNTATWSGMTREAPYTCREVAVPR